MKLKRTQEPEMIAPMPAVGGGAATVDPLNLGAEAAPASAGASTVGAAGALVCALLSIVLLGTTAWLIYQNLELIQNV